MPPGLVSAIPVLSRPSRESCVSRNVEIGQTVVADKEPPLFLIATDLALMRADATAGETDIGTVKPGDKVTFTVRSLPGHHFAGEVSRIPQTPRTIQNAAADDIAISAPNPDLLLEPGMTVTIRIVADRRDGVLRAPDQALRYAPGGRAAPAGAIGPGNSPDGTSRLWVLRDGKPVAIPVEPGLDDGAYTEIVKGDLRPGDDLIIGEDPAHGRK